jgi:hypothetical protein
MDPSWAFSLLVLSRQAVSRDVIEDIADQAVVGGKPVHLVSCHGEFQLVLGEDMCDAASLRA